MLVGSGLKVHGKREVGTVRRHGTGEISLLARARGSLLQFTRKRTV